MGTRSGAVSRAAAPDQPHAVNEIRLVGRLSAVPIERLLPSGDAMLLFRVIVPRLDRDGIDTIDCAAWSPGAKRSVRGWASGDTVQIQGRLRRRFFRTSGGPASRYEVEVVTAKRLVKAP